MPTVGGGEVETTTSGRTRRSSACSDALAAKLAKPAALVSLESFGDAKSQPRSTVMPSIVSVIASLPR